MGSVEACQQAASPTAEEQWLNSGNCRLEKYILKTAQPGWWQRPVAVATQVTEAE